MSDTLALQLAAASLKDKIPADKPLAERIAFSMRYVIKHQRDLLWMSAQSDDLNFRAALAGVMVQGNAEDKDIIERSLKPLKALAAAAQGIPVDFAQILADEEILPLMKMWHEAAASQHD